MTVNDPPPKPEPLAATRTAAPPNWDAVAEEVACPLCGYNLRGLVDPRCPECGYAFRWPALLDPNQRLHPYLFEHHPKRNVRSFLRTLVGGLRPGRFWSGLQPAQPSRPRRLVFYWVVVAILTFSASLAHAGVSLYAAVRLNESRRATAVPYLRGALSVPSAYQPVLQAEVRDAGGMQAWVDKTLPPTRSRRFFETWYRRYNLPVGIRVCAIAAAWPWLTFVTLMIFAASMRRAKVRPTHVLRCAIYCCDSAAWLLPLTVGAYLLIVKPGTPLSRDVSLNELVLVMATLLLPLYVTFRLTAAYRLYLRFDHPRATAAAAQLIVWLVIVIVLINMQTR